MKKIAFTILALGFVFTLPVNAQDDKKQEPKKEETKKQEPKKEDKKSEEAKPGGTRMAISQKGLPGKNSTKKDNDNQKTSGSGTETKKEEHK